MLKTGRPGEMSTSTWTTNPSRPMTAQVWALANTGAAPLAPANGKAEELPVVYRPVAGVTVGEERRPALRAVDSDLVEVAGGAHGAAEVFLCVVDQGLGVGVIHRVQVGQHQFGDSCLGCGAAGFAGC